MRHASLKQSPVSELALDRFQELGLAQLRGLRPQTERQVFPESQHSLPRHFPVLLSAYPKLLLFQLRQEC